MVNAQAASGYVELDGDGYRLPEEQALALAVEDSPVYVAGGAGVLAALFLDKDKQVAAQAGERRLRDVFTEAGFTSFRRATETPFNLVLEARK